VPRGSAAPHAGSTLLKEARAGLRASLQLPGVPVVIFALSAGMFFGGVFNVIELPFATDALGTGVSGYSVLVTFYGIGFIAGSLRGSSGGDAPRLKHRFLVGLLLTGIGSLVAGASFELVIALGAFAIGGFGNGLAIVHQRLLFHSEVASSLQGRVFAVSDAMTAWGFAVGFIGAGALAAAAGPRTLLLLIGVGEIVLAGAAAVALRRHWIRQPSGAPATLGKTIRRPELGGPYALGHPDVAEKGSHLIDGSRFWLTLLDDLRERGDDVGVELGPGVRD
jgi:MFS family permease